MYIMQIVEIPFTTIFVSSQNYTHIFDCHKINVCYTANIGINVVQSIKV